MLVASAVTDLWKVNHVLFCPVLEFIDLDTDRKIGLSSHNFPEFFDLICNNRCRSERLLSGRGMSKAFMLYVCSALVSILKIPCLSIKTDRLDIAILLPHTDG